MNCLLHQICQSFFDVNTSSRTVYVCGLKQATKMGLSLLHSPLTATSIWVNKSFGTGLCWLIQTLFQQNNHDGVLNFYRIANKHL